MQNVSTLPNQPHETGNQPRRARRWIVRILIIVFVLIAIAGGVFIAWASTPTGELLPEAINALESGGGVTVTDTGEWFEFMPESPATTGFIFYPGGKVLPEAYAPLMNRLAQEGYLAVAVKMPLNLAVLSPGKANQVIEAYPQITAWAIGGHSLGGAMSANFVKANPGKVQGLVLMASYPASFDDLSAAEGLTVASVYGTLDGLATPAMVEGSAPYLPANTIFVPIEGGNHAQFGYYGVQGGDQEATISREDQQQQIFAAVQAVLESISQ